MQHEEDELREWVQQLVQRWPDLTATVKGGSLQLDMLAAYVLIAVRKEVEAREAEKVGLPPLSSKDCAEPSRSIGECIKAAFTLFHEIEAHYGVDAAHRVFSMFRPAKAVAAENKNTTLLAVQGYLKPLGINGKQVARLIARANRYLAHIGAPHHARLSRGSDDEETIAKQLSRLR